MKLKIFYKKDFQGVLKEKEQLQGVYDELKKKYDNKEFKYLEGYSKYKDISEQLEIEKGLLLKENDDLKTKVKELQGTKGGLTKQVNKLTKELEEANTLIEEQKKELSKRYIVKTVRGTKPTKQTTKIKSSVKQSNAIKLVKEKL